MDDTDQTPPTAAIEPPEAGSTSSTPPAESPPVDSVAALGERILTELGEERTNNTLTRWLAHHTARLIEAADQAQAANAPDADACEAKAREAILQLWHARSDWPSGWPPPQAAETARLLDGLPSLDADEWYRRTVPARLHDIHHHVLAALVDLATGDASVDIEQGWLDAYGDHLTEDEAVMLRRAAGKPRRLDALLHLDHLYALLDMDVEEEEDHDADAVAEGADAHPLVKLADAYRDAVLDLVQTSKTNAPIVNGPVPDESRDGEAASSQAPPTDSEPGIEEG
ncbi:hypothetical protein [Streptomyces sp. TRM68416]|uniref:hypothetical protein n=1 Tax=Streptomyces sp. TRM68416 TaxID=2758412 RepID=UPI001661B748|nr:hypothetical protein [Streptomyces sp. TRM68416]MBD0840718.1 hypothetical protein [Streptomyces sp. TRM68416]